MDTAAANITQTHNQPDADAMKGVHVPGAPKTATEVHTQQRSAARDVTRGNQVVYHSPQVFHGGCDHIAFVTFVAPDDQPGSKRRLVWLTVMPTNSAVFCASRVPHESERYSFETEWWTLT